MDKIIKEIFNSFETSSKIPKQRYNDFLTHTYMMFDKKISLCKKSSEMNKYKKMRNYLLQYMAKNEKIITAEICKIK